MNSHHIRIHFSPEHDKIIGMGITEGATIASMLCASEYLLKVSADNTQNPSQYLLAAAEQVRMFQKAYDGKMPTFDVQEYKEPFLDLKVSMNEDFKAEVQIAAPHLSKTIADKCIDVAAPLMVYLLCSTGELPFEMVLKEIIDGAAQGYNTAYVRSDAE